MKATIYSHIKPLDDFDWSIYDDGYNGKNLIVNSRIRTNNGTKVYCHESYANEMYDKFEGKMGGQVYTSKDQIKGNIYNIKDIIKISKNEVRLDTDGGGSAVVDLNKEHQFIETLGVNTVSEFMIALDDPENKKIVLNYAKNAKVVANRVSIWEGIRYNIEKDFMDQLVNGQTKGYTAKILMINNGGYTVDINGVKCFLPGSLAASGPIDDFESLLGKNVNVCVVNYSKNTNNFVVSHKKYLELTLPDRVKEMLYPGLKVYVKVTGISKNGMFCAIRDDNGDFPYSSLMHRSMMSPEQESNFDKGEFSVGDCFYAYIQRVDWSDNGNFRIYVCDQKSYCKIEQEDLIEDGSTN